jgi:hypothetical protein
MREPYERTTCKSTLREPCEDHMFAPGTIQRLFPHGLAAGPGRDRERSRAIDPAANQFYNLLKVIILLHIVTDSMPSGAGSTAHRTPILRIKHGRLIGLECECQGGVVSSMNGRPIAVSLVWRFSPQWRRRGLIRSVLPEGAGSTRGTGRQAFVVYGSDWGGGWRLLPGPHWVCWRRGSRRTPVTTRSR